MKNRINALCRLGSLIFLISLTLPVLGSSLSDRLLDDEKRVTEYYKECVEIKDYGIRTEFEVSCFRNYHHFNTDNSKFYKSREVKKEIRILENQLLFLI